MCIYSKKKEHANSQELLERWKETSLWLTIMSEREPATQQRKRSIEMALQLSSFFTGQFDLQSKLKAPFPNTDLSIIIGLSFISEVQQTKT